MREVRLMYTGENISPPNFWGLSCKHSAGLRQVHQRDLQALEGPERGRMCVCVCVCVFSIASRPTVQLM